MYDNEAHNTTMNTAQHNPTPNQIFNTRPLITDYEHTPEITIRRIDYADSGGSTHAEIIVNGWRVASIYPWYHDTTTRVESYAWRILSGSHRVPLVIVNRDQAKKTIPLADIRTTSPTVDQIEQAFQQALIWCLWYVKQHIHNVPTLS